VLSRGIRGLVCRTGRSDEPLCAINGEIKLIKEKSPTDCSHAQAETKLWPRGVVQAKQAVGRDTDDRAGISRRCFGDGIAGCELKR